MTGDQRVTYAREYLDGARERKVTELPPSLLVREVAELRRQLGQVLDAIEQAEDGRPPAAYELTLRQALADAIMFRQARAAGGDDSDQIGLYRTVARDGGLPVPEELPSAGVLLAPAEMATVLDGLAVAAEYRRYRPSLTCEACAIHPAELCEACATDLDRADEYDQLADRIGGAR